MIGIDTNILLRLVIEDETEQTMRAAGLLDTSRKANETLFVCDVTLCETVWVLRSGYRHRKATIIDILQDLIDSADFDFQSPDSLDRAFEDYKHGKADFADYLIGARCAEAGCRVTATFDKALLKEEGFVGVEGNAE